MRCAWVQVDMNRLAMRLWQAHGQWPTDWDLRRWMKDGGCEWHMANWFICCEGALGHLEAGEIIEVQTHETTDGITFITRERRPPPPSPPDAPHAAR